MRDLRLLDAYRIVIPGFGAIPPEALAIVGTFRVPHRPTGASLLVIASAAEGWDHVSVSLPNRCPNWPEMSRIKDLFFRDDEVAMQLHVPAADHINNHPHCLHLWRPHDAEIPRPPGALVGAKDLSPEQVGAMSTAQRRAVREATAETFFNGSAR
ncbi:DUF7694 domain-containing protein [Methylobacterium sp. JK268]